MTYKASVGIKYCYNRKILYCLLLTLLSKNNILVFIFALDSKKATKPPFRQPSQMLVKKSPLGFVYLLCFFL